MTILIGIVFTLISAIFAAVAALGLPGTWLIIAFAALIDVVELLWKGDSEPTFGWVAFAIALLLAAAAEIIEFLAGAAGAKAGGASRRGTVGALVGGFVGGIVGTFVIPIPLVGTLVGASMELTGASTTVLPWALGGTGGMALAGMGA
ncbi:MAG: DUF456 family protein, partial [Phycisphaeraceae bacterium]|nr:DUF456 family protein [Phycisphaeraceae bacterium]